MELLLYILPLLFGVFGFIAGRFITQRQQGEASLNWARRETELNAQVQQTQHDLQRLEAEQEALHREVSRLRGQLQEETTQSVRLQSELNAAMQRLEENQSQWKTLWETQLQQFLSKELEGTRERLQQLVKQEDETRSERFETLVKPVKEMLGQYQDKLQHMDAQYQKQMGALGEQIGSLMQAKQQLVSVLSHNKSIGDWGELQLLRILELAGLRRDVDFEVQPTIEEGRPDVKVNLPAGRYVFIDAKAVQLSNQVRETQALEEGTLDEGGEKRLAASIKTVTDELSRKNYTKGKETSCPDFVVLFLPKESMLSQALEHDPQLWEYAWHKRILLASPLTLVAVLRMIAIGWQHERLSQDMQQVVEVGRKVHDKVLLLAERVVKVEDQYTTLGKSIQAVRTAYDGNQGLVKASMEFKELGVDSGRAIPAKLTDAPFELGEV